MKRPNGNPARPVHPLVAEYQDELLTFSDSKSLRTAETYGHSIQNFNDWLRAEYDTDLDGATRTMVKKYLVMLHKRGCSASRRRVVLYALRSFYRWRLDEGAIATDPTANIRIPKQDQRKVHPYTDVEAARMLSLAANAVQTAPSDRARLRAQVELLVLMLLRYVGPRVSELTTLRIDGVDLANHKVTVLGKGSKVREVPLTAELVAMLRVYLDEVRPQLPGDTYLLSNPYAYPGSKTYGQLIQRAIYDICVKHGKKAEVGGKHHPHRWRHSMGTTLVRHGLDVETLRKLMGHASILTTLIYVDLAEDDVSKKTCTAWEQEHQARQDDDADDDGDEGAADEQAA